MSRLVVSSVIESLAASQGFDLSILLLAASRRPLMPPNVVTARPACLLDWAGNDAENPCGPRAALSFFETYELHPGLVLRDWHDPRGRLGFGIDEDRVLFEIFARSSGVLVRGTPGRVDVIPSVRLPEASLKGAEGRLLTDLVEWRDADAIRISRVEDIDGQQVLRASTEPIVRTFENV